MTDEQIIKALECCGNIVDSTCKECTYHETYNASCVVRLMRDALDLYNRQKAEIEALQFSVQQLSGFISNAKSETIKEYKEKVKAIIMDKGIYPVVVKNALNEAEKELVGK